jgi:hypothetical protein
MWSSTIVILFIIIFIALFMRTRLKFREKAILIAKKECNVNNFQLLDESVELVSTKLQGKYNFILLRVYNFEYSYDSVQRNIGVVEIFGQNKYKVFFPDSKCNPLGQQSDNIVELSSYRREKRNSDAD